MTKRQLKEVLNREEFNYLGSHIEGVCYGFEYTTYQLVEWWEELSRWLEEHDFQAMNEVMGVMEDYEKEHSIYGINLDDDGTIFSYELLNENKNPYFKNNPCALLMKEEHYVIYEGFDPSIIERFVKVYNKYIKG